MTYCCSPSTGPDTRCFLETAKFLAGSPTHQHPMTRHRCLECPPAWRSVARRQQLATSCAFDFSFRPVILGVARVLMLTLLHVCCFQLTNRKAARKKRHPSAFLTIAGRFFSLLRFPPSAKCYRQHFHLDAKITSSVAARARHLSFLLICVTRCGDRWRAGLGTENTVIFTSSNGFSLIRSALHL